MSTTEENVLDAIKKGMRCALNDATVFTEDFKAAINTEYLATVNIAKAVSRQCPLVGSGDLRIVLEMKTREFATEALPLMTPGGDFQRRVVLRKRLNASRNGRVDIAIQKGVSSLERRSWCAIEVKGFKPQAHTVKLDLRRNIEFLSLEGPTGKSGVALTVFCAYHECKDVIFEHQVPAAEAAVKARYDNFVKTLELGDSIGYDVDVFRAGAFFATGNETDEEAAYLDEPYYFVGVLVIFRRKNPSA